MNRDYYKWWSAALAREMEILVFGNAGTRLLVFPSRLNRFFEYEDRGMVVSLRHSIEAGQIQLICVDSIDAESLYCFDKPPEFRLRRQLEYERYVIEEVLPFSEKLNPGTELVAHGCSLGAYHAAALAMRHPAKFHGLLAFSGRYDLTRSFGEYYNLFHGFSDPVLDQLMPSLFVPALKDSKTLRQLRKLRLTFVIGEEDAFYENNCGLSSALARHKIKHQFHIWAGAAHRFRYWRQMVRIYLDSVLPKTKRKTLFGRNVDSPRPSG